MLLHLLGIFNANLLQHYLFLEDLQSFDRTCSKEPDQITVLCDVHQDEVFQCMYPQSSRSHCQQTASLLNTFCFRYRLFWKRSFIPPLSDLTHRFCSQTKTIGDRNCTACFSLANIFNQSTNKSFGAKLQSEVTGGFTQVRIGYLINHSATSCAISIPPLLEDSSEQKTFKDVCMHVERFRNLKFAVKRITNIQSTVLSSSESTTAIHLAFK